MQSPSHGWVTFGWAASALLALLVIGPTALRSETPAGESAEETPLPRGVLIISAADFDGMPMEGVNFQATLPGEDSPRTFTTKVNGEVEIPDLEDPGSVKVALGDEDYVTASPTVVINQSATILAWRLYRRDVSQMGEEERQEFARAFHEIVRDSEESSALINEKARILASFLTGGDRGSTLPNSGAGDKEDSPSGVLSVRLIDSRGEAQAGSLMQLYSYQSSTKSVELVDYERTNAEGLAVFADLELGRYYRVEVIEDGDLTARSTIVHLKSEDPNVLPTMILRPRAQILSGLVVDAADVAAGTLVTARRPSDGLMMTAATDGSGYFSLAPFSTRNEVTLTFEQSTSAGVRTGVMTARPGEAELLVPLHVLEEN